MLLTSHSVLLCCCYPPKMSIINLEAWLSFLVCFHTSVSAGQLSLAVPVLSWRDNYNRWYLLPSLFSHHWWESVMGPGLPYHAAKLLKHLVASCRVWGQSLWLVLSRCAWSWDKFLCALKYLLLIHSEGQARSDQPSFSEEHLLILMGLQGKMGRKIFFLCIFFYQKPDLKCTKAFFSPAIFNSNILRHAKAAALGLIVENALCRSAFCVFCWQGFKCLFKGWHLGDHSVSWY